MSQTERIVNPFDKMAEGLLHAITGSDETMDATWSQEVNQAAAAEVQKRNSAPPGTYVTAPEEYEPIINTGPGDEKDKSGMVTGKRQMATVIARGTARVKVGEERKDVTQILRFKLSPEGRQKKAYEGNQWTGEYEAGKDDMATRLWANAVGAFQEQHGKGTFTNADILNYLKTTPVALRAMQGDRGELVVLQIQNRGRRCR